MYDRPTLAELVAAYSAFARGGMLLRPVGVRSADRTPERLISSRSAFWITDILSDADAREYVFGRGTSLDFPFRVAAKTGTSEGYHDNWAIGYTREVTVGVWVGNFDRTPLANSSGVTGAGPIFHSVMLAAQNRFAGEAMMVNDERLMTPQDGLVRTPICALSGMPADSFCPSRTHEWLPARGPALPCSWHHETGDGVLVVWPPEYRQWASDQNRDRAPVVVASASGMRLRQTLECPEVRVPLVSYMSFKAKGMPCSGPRYLPAMISCSACFAC